MKFKRDSVFSATVVTVTDEDCLNKPRDSRGCISLDGLISALVDLRMQNGGEISVWDATGAEVCGAWLSEPDDEFGKPRRIVVG